MKVDNRRYDTEAIRQRHPLLAEVRRRGIDMKPEGKAYVALCPFHSDHNTPNFYVYPSSGRWWCYVCRKGGDVIEFVKRLDNVGFVEACERLEGAPPGAGDCPAPPAAAHEPLRWECLTPGQQMFMDAAAASYRAQLWRQGWVIDILHQRGIGDWTIRECGLGYCDGETFREFMLQEGRIMRQAFTLGLLRTHRLNGSEAEPFESLAGRIVIPEYRDGHAIWFIGRLVEDSPDVALAAGQGDAPPKYFGLHGARPILGYERTLRQPEIFLCEGPFDWLTAVQWGLPAFSACGTYVPAERLVALDRSSVVYGLLDGDQAGLDGGERLLELLPGRFRRLLLPENMDLNDIGAGMQGRQRFAELLHHHGLSHWADRLGYAPPPVPWWRRLRIEFVPPWERIGKGDHSHAA
jgi:DNA primase